MADSALLSLRRERAAKHRACLAVCRELAHAFVHERARLPDLEETMHRLYDQRAALDMAIASYDPQQGLFPDTIPA